MSSLPTFLPTDTRHQGVRGLIACVASFIAFLGFWAVHAWAQANPEGGRQYDAVVLDLVQVGLLGAMGLCGVLGYFFWRVLRTGIERPWLSTALTVALSLSYTLLGIAYGFYTTPMSFVIMGVLAFGLVFFDRRAVLSGFGASVSLFVGYEWLMSMGWIDYAPLLSRHMFDGDSTTLAWWWGIHLRVILYVAFFAFFALLMFQMDQLEAQRAALERLSTTDPMTGVANRRRFGERLDEEIMRRARSGRAFSVLLCDADFFKKVNDTYGHHAGDEVIRHIATLLNRNVRLDIDLVGRLGGEEFGVLLPETPAERAVEVAQRVLAQMRQHEFCVEGRCFRVTLSIGVCEATEGSGEEALRIADARLYLAKSGGRDRVVAVDDAVVSGDQNSSTS